MIKSWLSSASPASILRTIVSVRPVDPHLSPSHCLSLPLSLSLSLPPPLSLARASARVLSLSLPLPNDGLCCHLTTKMADRNLCIPCGTKVRDQGRPCPTCRQPIERMLRADHDVPVPVLSVLAPSEPASEGSPL